MTKVIKSNTAQSPEFQTIKGYDNIPDGSYFCFASPGNGKLTFIPEYLKASPGSHSICLATGRVWDKEGFETNNNPKKFYIFTEVEIIGTVE